MGALAQSDTSKLQGSLSTRSFLQLLGSLRSGGGPLIFIAPAGLPALGKLIYIPACPHRLLSQFITRVGGHSGGQFCWHARAASVEGSASLSAQLKPWLPSRDALRSPHNSSRGYICPRRRLLGRPPASSRVGRPPFLGMVARLCWGWSPASYWVDRLLL